MRTATPYPQPPRYGTPTPNCSGRADLLRLSKKTGGLSGGSASMLWPAWRLYDLFLAVLAFNLLGDGLRDVLDPKARR